MTWIFIFLFFLYMLLIAVLLIGWSKSIIKPTFLSIDQEPFVSVIIPVRNESNSIGKLLEDICHQSYINFEVVVVNDHSRDNTSAVVMTYVNKNKRFQMLNSGGEGKKAALTEGIHASHGEIIVTTDGDCRVDRDWLISLISYFRLQNTNMVFGGVKIEGDSFFSKIQAQEFLSLIGTGAATLSMGFPSMCNGANLAFRKSIFLEVGGYSGNLHIPSGDDEFLLHKIFSLYPGGISFVSNQNAVVRTNAAPNLKHFVHQRIRWAGKWKHNTSLFTSVLAFFIFCFQSATIILMLALIAGKIGLLMGILLLFSKAIAEFIFLKKVSDFHRVPWNWSAFVLLQFFYPLYAVGVGMIANLCSFEWKGRNLKSFTVSPVEK